jgi:hypothetical protein
VEVLPLLRGFCARLSCPKEGWFKSYGARHIRLDYYTDSADFEPQSVEIYTVTDRQNLALQKTILGLGGDEFIYVRFVLLNDDLDTIFSSSPQAVKTLN